MEQTIVDYLDINDIDPDKVIIYERWVHGVVENDEDDCDECDDCQTDSCENDKYEKKKQKMQC
jgi:hypothetical protein